MNELPANLKSDNATSSDSFFTSILKPGSSLNPYFLAILDIAFCSLFIVLSSLLYLTSGNPHLVVLILIELTLWASVKWFVNELKTDVPTIMASATNIQGDAKLSGNLSKKHS